MLRDGTLRRLRRGVFVESRRWELLDPYRGRPLLRARAAQLCLRCDHVLSHDPAAIRSEEHTSELQSLMRISYAVFCLKKKKTKNPTKHQTQMQQTEHNE